MSSSPKTILKKSTSDNMNVLIKTVLKNVKKSDAPTIKENMINWGNYNVAFLENDQWEFSKPNEKTIHRGKFPSGIGHVSDGIRTNIKPTIKIVDPK